MSTLRDEFQDRDYRRAYAESLANTTIATQIRLLRGGRTQKEFAELIGVKQSRISAMEDENYSAWSTTTLKRIAAANDVVFFGRFMAFGELLDWARRLSEDALRVVSFAQDPAFSEPTTVARVLTFPNSQPEPRAQMTLAFTPGNVLALVEPRPPTQTLDSQASHTPRELYGRTERVEGNRIEQTASGAGLL